MFSPVFAETSIDIIFLLCANNYISSLVTYLSPILSHLLPTNIIYTPFTPFVLTSSYQ